MALLLIGAIFHLYSFLAVMDIYFRSPISSNLLSPPEAWPPLESSFPAEARRVTPNEAEPQAHRVVLIVADGLRADTCFSFMGRDERYLTPEQLEDEDFAMRRQVTNILWDKSSTSFLREVIETKGGQFGVAHTRVPTETRPGHVALIAGLYEDVSAVTRGWQENPVEFDHVFRGAAETFAWGHRDVLRLFVSKDASQLASHPIRMEHPPGEEDFAATKLSEMDTWVFNRVTHFLHEARPDAARTRQVFFLHLGALDANGHKHLPHSPDYYANMDLVDRGVAGLYNVFESLFKDNRTAYVFASDHGMSDRGAHGDGDPTNTRTPLVVWGAGVSPLHSESTVSTTGWTPKEELEETKRWGLNFSRRLDVEHADVSHLLAALLGQRPPSHSVGKTPSAYLAPGAARCRAMLRGAEQLTRQAHAKEYERASRSTKMRFQPFAPLTTSLSKLGAAHRAEAAGDVATCEAQSAAAVEGVVDALRYYQTYDRNLLSFGVIAGFFGFIAVIMNHVLEVDEGGLKKSDDRRSGAAAHSSTGSGGAAPLQVLVCAPLVFFGIVFIIEQSAWSHPLYFFAPAGFWGHALRRDSNVSRFWSRLESGEKLALAWRAVVALAATQLLGKGYTARWCFSILLVGMSIWRPSKAPLNRVVAWRASLLFLGVFTVGPLIQKGDVLWLSLAAIFAVLGSWLIVDRLQGERIYYVQLAVLIISCLVALSTDLYHTNQLIPHSALMDFLLVDAGHVVAWAVLLASPFVPKYVARPPPSSDKHTLSVYLALAAPLALLSVNIELGFFLLLSGALYAWIKVEEAERGEPDESRATALIRDARRALFLLIFLHVSFFGQGNFVTLASFDVTSVFRFVTEYKPFVMGGLLIAKILVPDLFVAVSAVRVFARQQGDSAKLFLIVLALCDATAVPLYFNVRDDGSWLEIGNSIAQFGFIVAHFVAVPALFLVSVRLFS